MPTPPELLAAMLGTDPARPRVTCYDDVASPPERIELSAKVLANWVAKASNCLVEEYDVGVGSRVHVDLPALHWRTLYWSLAVWSAGAELVAGPGPTDVTVSTDDRDADILVTLAALARAHPGGVAAGAMDEARGLSTYGDVFDPQSASTGADWVDAGDLPPGTRLAVGGAPTLPDFLRAVLAAWAVDGSVVLLRGTDPQTAQRRADAEGVTALVSAGSG